MPRASFRQLLLLAAIPLVAARADAHAPSAIVVDDEGQVFFTDAEEGVYRINGSCGRTRVSPEAMHWMALDRKGAFANASDTFGEWFYRVTPKGKRPTLISCSDFPCAIGADGNLYFAKMHGLAIVRRTPDGEERTIIDADDYGLGPGAWGVNGMTCARDGTIYLVALDSVNKQEGTGEHILFAISPTGEIDEVTRNFVHVQLADGQEYSEARPQYCRGMATDDAGNIYVAVTGSRCVIKVDKDGKTTEVLRAEHPWSPTGVDVHEGSVYVLEYNDELPVERRKWPLRVRKLRDGQLSTLVAIRAK
jgi:hypothetical protein